MTSPPPPPPTSTLHYITTLDTSLSLTLYTLTQPILPRPFLKLLELSGDGRLFFPIILSIIISSLPSTSPSPHPLPINLLIGSLLDLILVGTLKHLVRRPRPVYNKHMFVSFSVDHWSFPSGHASRVCFIASLIWFSSKDSGFNINTRVGVVVWAGATSVSRVLLGRHFCFDVVAGACLGILNAAFVFFYFNYEFFVDVFSKKVLL